MEIKENLRKQINELEEQLKPLNEKYRQIIRQEEKITDEKIEQCHAANDKFILEELIFSAASRCGCGAGLAYPKGIGMRGAWYCSDVLLGRAITKDKPESKTHDSFPFAFYEIKSENQPSANGQTTRPKE